MLRLITISAGSKTLIVYRAVQLQFINFIPPDEVLTKRNGTAMSPEGFEPPISRILLQALYR